MRVGIRTLTGLGVLALTAAIVPTGAATTANAATKPIGYLYATTFVGFIDQYAVEPDYSLKVVGSVATAYAHTYSLAVLHTKGGMFLYAAEGVSGPEGDIYQYKINPKTGVLTATTNPPITGVVSGLGNGLLAFDGYASSTSDADAIYSDACPSLADCGAGGFAHYSVNQSTGALKLAGSVTPLDIESQSIDGTEIDQLISGDKGGFDVVPIKIDPKTGNLLTGASFALTESDNNTIPSQATVVATKQGDVGVAPVKQTSTTVGPVVYPSTGTHLSQGDGHVEAGSISALQFTSNHLVAGETGSTGGPQIELFTPDGATSAGVIDLTKPPYNDPTGSTGDPNFVTRIFTLGKGVYIGTYEGAAIQATDGYEGKGFVINKTDPFITDSGQTYGMAGYLFKTTTTKTTKTSTTTTVAGHLKSGKVRVHGTVKSGVKGTKITVELLRRTGLKYLKVKTVKTTLHSTHKFATTFAKPTAGKCEVKATYPGTSITTASHAAATFTC